MLCPFCGDRRTEVLETVYRGHSTYRQPRRSFCKSHFSVRERQILSSYTIPREAPAAI